MFPIYNTVQNNAMLRLSIKTKFLYTELILGVRPANERRRYFFNEVSNWLGANLESTLYTVIALMRSSGTKHALNCHDNWWQYGPYNIV